MVKMCSAISDIADMAVISYTKYKILPSMIIAQAWLESGNGKSQLATVNNNYFGLKWYNTEVTRPYNYIVAKTTEERNGQMVTINDRFCTFDNPIQSLECLYRWYTIYTKYHTLKGVTDYRSACQLVRECGYATDSKYTDKLIKIIEREHLTAYDAKALIATETIISPHYIKLYAGSFTIYNNAVNHLVNVRRVVPNAFIVKNGDYWRVQVGAFIEPQNANNFEAFLNKQNIATFKEG